ncbi:hypothetical protein D3C76_1732780 [compost metagenome]
MGVILTGGTTDDDAVHLGLDQVLEHFGECRFVDVTAGGQGRDCRGVDAFEFHDLLSNCQGCFQLSG